MPAAFDKIRAYCLAKPGAFEDEPWPGDKAFKVNGKIFAMSGGESLTVKSTVEKQEVLILHPHIRKAAYVGRFGWVTIELVEDMLDMAFELIDESYEVVAKKQSAKSRKS